MHSQEKQDHHKASLLMWFANVFGGAWTMILEWTQQGGFMFLAGSYLVVAPLQTFACPGLVPAGLSVFTRREKKRKEKGKKKKENILSG